MKSKFLKDMQNAQSAKLQAKDDFAREAIKTITSDMDTLAMDSKQINQADIWEKDLDNSISSLINNPRINIEKDIAMLLALANKQGIILDRMILNKKLLKQWRILGVKYFQLTDKQINNPSKIKGYVGKCCGLKVYIR